MVYCYQTLMNEMPQVLRLVLEAHKRVEVMVQVRMGQLIAQALIEVMLIQECVV